MKIITYEECIAKYVDLMKLSWRETFVEAEETDDFLFVMYQGKNNRHNEESYHTVAVRKSDGKTSRFHPIKPVAISVGHKFNARQWCTICPGEDAPFFLHRAEGPAQEIDGNAHTFFLGGKVLSKEDHKYIVETFDIKDGVAMPHEADVMIKLITDAR